MSDGMAAARQGALVAWIMEPSSMGRGEAFRWGVALAAVLAGLLARVALDPVLGGEALHATFLPAVLLAAAFAGTGPAVGALVACGLAGWLLFGPPLGSLAISGAEAAALLAFAAVGAAGIALVHALRQAFHRLAQAEARARRDAEQRGLICAELRHRVSGNLSAVGALLTLRTRGIEDPEARRALDEAAARLEVVARLCHQLHDPAMREVELGAFLRAMVPDALAVRGAEDRIGVEVEAEEIVVPASRAVPLGLVATELLSNAVEHGFPSGQGGRIRVSLERTGESCARLLVRHDGEGLPPGFDLGKVGSLGLTVARQFAQQLGAELLVTQDRGVVSCLSFPVAEPAGA